MVVGVNGVGKTTTIGKLAKRYKDKGYKVLLGAGDRAAAIEQLEVWASVLMFLLLLKKWAQTQRCTFDLESAISQNADMFCDTAGRLHNKKGLMEELGKVKRVMQKLIPDAPMM